MLGTASLKRSGRDDYLRPDLPQQLAGDVLRSIAEPTPRRARRHNPPQHPSLSHRALRRDPVRWRLASRPASARQRAVPPTIITCAAPPFIRFLNGCAGQSERLDRFSNCPATIAARSCGAGGTRATTETSASRMNGSTRLSDW